MGFWNRGAERKAQEETSAAAAAESELRQSLIEDVMNASQAAWKEERKRQHPDETTRFRKTEDTAWIKENEGGTNMRKNEDGSYEADLLAIDSASALPREYKADTERNAMIAVGAILNAAKNGRTPDDAFIDEVAALIHVRWLDVHRNDSYTTEEQKLPFAEMGENEKNKDRDFVRLAIATYDAKKK